MENIIGLAQGKEVANLTWRDLFVISMEMILVSILAVGEKVGTHGRRD
jgi:hypothetical protein